MRRGLVLIATLSLVPTEARADAVAELVSAGQDLARLGQYDAAVEKFQAADRLRPRTVQQRGRGLSLRDHLIELTIGGGTALVLAGAVVHVAALRPAHGDLVGAPDDESLRDRHSNIRAATVALYTTGAIAIGAGWLLHRRTNKIPLITAGFGRGSALVTLEWNR